ncbi:MAG: hypothetical protein CBC74_001715 [Crocinitomicaceae bacterium TMED114]|nr:MAG: hypothetical protein CBC74_001715 [Crocinitomicaceae bacterium TMED114]
MSRTLLFATALFTGLAFTLGANAQEDGAKETATYGVSVGISPFGPSLGFAHNLSEKTTVQVSLGAFSGDNPVDQDIAGATFAGTGETNWMGIFLNHRPFEDYDWIRFNVGIGIGGIEATLTDVNDANHTYDIRYGDNPVGYVGIGFGSRPVEGVTVGFDIGGLHTSGATIASTGTTVNADVLDEIPNTFGYGRVLPNFQLSVGYGF